jgi:uncharacterized SAM-binding protein YcdF (DUF218 family)
VLVAALAALGAGLAERSVYRAIRAQAARDEARPAPAIVVFGAAEYNGVPSPVFRARLHHAFDLEERGLAPWIITTGGSGGDRRFTEGGVGRDDLIQQGVPAGKITAETRSDTTAQSARAVARLLRQRQARACIAVSDGFHLYRIKMLLREEGITAYASPDPGSPIEADPVRRSVYSLREMLIVTAWQLGIRE